MGGKVKWERRRVTYTAWVARSGSGRPALLASARVTLPKPVADLWRQLSVEEVNVRLNEDGSVTLIPVKNRSAAGRGTSGGACAPPLSRTARPRRQR
ncbi:MAG: hypothetical protein QXI55_06600 [Thermofilum sp.]